MNQSLLQATEQEFTKTKTNVTSFIATTELDRAIEERKGAYKALVDKLKTEIQTYNVSLLRVTDRQPADSSSPAFHVGQSLSSLRQWSPGG